MKKRRWIGLAAVVLLSGACIVGVHAASKWYEADWRAVKECRESHFVCVSKVTGKLPLDQSRKEPPVFEGVARACEFNPAWERAIFRAKFDCEVSTRVEHGSCFEVDTNCDLETGT